MIEKADQWLPGVRNEVEGPEETFGCGYVHYLSYDDCLMAIHMSKFSVYSKYIQFVVFIPQ